MPFARVLFRGELHERTRAGGADACHDFISRAGPMRWAWRLEIAGIEQGEHIKGYCCAPACPKQGSQHGMSLMYTVVTCGLWVLDLSGT